MTNIDRIANDLGCDLVPTATRGALAIQVQRRWQQGGEADRARIAQCRAAIEAAGVDTSRWVS